jgi:hypothetical protein
MHGNWRLALGLLEQEGLIDYDDEQPRRLRTEDRVVQLGDLCNCVRGSINDDIQSTRLVGPIIDEMVVGNHEHPYFGGPPFDGFAWFAELREAIHKLDDRGLIQAALEVDGILLTHAGITRDFDAVDRWHEGDENKAREVANGLNWLWHEKQYTHAMFSAIGQLRGGIHPHGGILWSDWREAKATILTQIVGHTVGKTWRAEGPVNGTPSFMLIRPYADATPLPVQTLCIDIGAGKHSRNILGCWIRDGEVELVQYEQQD